jgi:hypothetical protein
VRQYVAYEKQLRIEMDRGDQSVLVASEVEDEIVNGFVLSLYRDQIDATECLFQVSQIAIPAIFYELEPRLQRRGGIDVFA